MRHTLFLLAFVSLSLPACSKSQAEPTVTAEPSATVSAAPSTSTPWRHRPHGPMAGSGAPDMPAGPLALAWTDPPRWTRGTPRSPMRKADYVVPKAGADADDAECTVITFGPGQGGSIDENVERWVKQLEPATSKVDRTTRKVGGMNVTRVEVAGTFTPMQMGAHGGGAAPGPKTGYRLVGEIVEAPSGMWFFKLIGPDATVKAASKELDALVDSVHPS